MEKVNKKTEIAKMLGEGKTVNEVAVALKTNIAYVYKLKRQIKCNTTVNITEAR